MSDAAIEDSKARHAALAAAAIEAAGGAASLARAIGRVSRYAVHLWKQGGIPAARVRDVSRITGIPPHQLRPDLFEPPAQPQPAAEAA